MSLGETSNIEHRTNDPLVPWVPPHPSLLLHFAEEKEKTWRAELVHGPTARPLLEVEALHEPLAEFSSRPGSGDSQKRCRASLATAVHDAGGLTMDFKIDAPADAPCQLGFMEWMRDFGIVEASHEPAGVPGCFATFSNGNSPAGRRRCQVWAVGSWSQRLEIKIEDEHEDE